MCSNTPITPAVYDLLAPYLFLSIFMHLSICKLHSPIHKYRDWRQGFDDFEDENKPDDRNKRADKNLPNN
jgi:hypothetical protein